MPKMTKDELIAVLHALERKGMIESRIDADGEVRWRATAKGRAVRRAIRDGEADWPEDSRYGLDS
jgi:DNA-binding PadR family transcriptional regulator